MYIITKINDKNLNIPININIKKENDIYVGINKKLNIKHTHKDKYTLIDEIKNQIITLYIELLEKQKLSDKELKVKDFLQKIF